MRPDTWSRSMPDESRSDARTFDPFPLETAAKNSCIAFPDVSRYHLLIQRHEVGLIEGSLIGNLQDREPPVQEAEMPNQPGQFDDLTIDVAGHRGIVEFVEPRVGAIVCLKHLAQIGEVLVGDGVGVSADLRGVVEDNPFALACRRPGGSRARRDTGVFGVPPRRAPRH